MFQATRRRLAVWYTAVTAVLLLLFATAVYVYVRILLRQVTQRVQIGRQVLGYLRVSHPWFEVTKSTRLLILDLSLGITIMVISVAASGWWLSGLAMEPVRESYQRLKQPFGSAISCGCATGSGARHGYWNPLGSVTAYLRPILSRRPSTNSY